MFALMHFFFSYRAHSVGVHIIRGFGAIVRSVSASQDVSYSYFVLDAVLRFGRPAWEVSVACVCVSVDDKTKQKMALKLRLTPQKNTRVSLLSWYHALGDFVICACMGLFSMYCTSVLYAMCSLYMYTYMHFIVS